MFDDTLSLSSQQPMAGGAEFSDDGVYRYRLWREWDTSLPTVLFIMLNPSTADAAQDDPTVRRCIDYARRWGYGKLLVGNIFALRSTDPKRLYEADDPVGQANDGVLLDMHDRAELTVCAWGVHGHLRNRGDTVATMLKRHRPGSLHCLGITKGGAPKHPLYLPKSAMPMPMRTDHTGGPN